MAEMVLATTVLTVAMIGVFLALIAINIALFLALRSGIPQGPFTDRGSE